MTHRRLSIITIALAILMVTASAQNDFVPPLPDGYMSVSEIVQLPQFIPGVGALYIHPDNAPVGPWLAYDKDGTLVEVLFMMPLSQMQNSTDWNDLSAGIFDELKVGAVDHVDVTFNAGHPGMAEAHYHVRLVLVDNERQQSALAR